MHILLAYWLRLASLSTWIVGVSLIAACNAPPDRHVEAARHSEPGDSARAAQLAIAALERRADTLVDYRVHAFVADSVGYLVTVVPTLRPQYADKHIAIGGGGGTVRVAANGTVTVVERFR